MSTDTFTSLRPAVAAGLLQRVRASRWAPLPVVLSGTFMVVLDFFIVNVALPSIQSGSARRHAASIEWIVAGYGLTYAVLLITGGRLGDQLRPASDVHGGAGAVHGQLGGVRVRVGRVCAGRRRLVQGCGGALLMPNVMSIIGVVYDGADRVRRCRRTG